MKLFITGASSPLGLGLTSELSKTEKFSIRLLEHRLPLPKGRFQTYRGDIQDPNFLFKACNGIDTVFHLAALTHSRSGQAYFKVNENGTENLITSCRKNKVRRIIYVSSSTASEAGGDYAASKLRAEQLVKESGLEWVIVRISEMYGSNLTEGIAKLSACIKAYPILPVIGNGRYFLSPVHVDDVVQAMVGIVRTFSGDKTILNLCGPETMTMNQLIHRISRIQNAAPKTIHVPLWLARIGIHLLTVLKPGFAVPDQIRRLLCQKEQSIVQTQALIPYNPRTLEEGLSPFPSKNI